METGYWVTILDVDTGCLDDIELLREKHIPQDLRVVFLGESRPDPGEGQPRMFYLPYLSSHDNLFRGLMKALYDADAADLAGRKGYWVDRFKGDGFWLLDAVPYPVNRLSQKERRQALLSNVDLTTRRIDNAGPSHGTIICHGGTYRVIAGSLKAQGITILHDLPIPFPLAAQKPRFISEVRRILREAGIHPGVTGS